MGWIIIFFIFPSNELSQFLENTFLILTTLEYIHGIIFPAPFSDNIRSTKSLLLFLITGFLIIFQIRKFNKNNTLFLLAVFFMFIISLIYFKYALSRSDHVHIKIGLSFLYLPFFSLVFFSIIDTFGKKIQSAKFLMISSFFIFMISIIVDKKYENKNILNVKSSFKSMNKLIKYEDYIFLDKNYNEFLNYFKELTNKDDCVTVFTNEVAIPYFLKKPTCTKYYLMYTANPLEIQNKMIKDFNTKKPQYLIYSSELDTYGNNSKKLELVNQFFKKNYQFYKKFNHWEVHKVISN